MLRLLLLLLTGLALHAAPAYYIKIASASSESRLFDLKWRLQELGYPIAYVRKNGWYRVYAGPIPEKSVGRALEQIRARVAPGAEVVGGMPLPGVAKERSVAATPVRVSRPAAVTVVPVSQPAPRTTVRTAVAKPEAAAQPAEPAGRTRTPGAAVTPETNAPSRSYDYYAAFSGSYSVLNVEQTDTRGTLVLDRQPDDAGTGYGVELGYYFSDSLLASVNYDTTDLDDSRFDKLYLTLSYRFRPYDFIRPYVGILGGYGRMRWKESLIGSTNNDMEAYSFFGGIQAGADLWELGPLSIFALYRYFHAEYDTKIYTFAADGELTHDEQQSFNLGIRLSF